MTVYRSMPEALNPHLGKVVSGFVALLAEAERAKVLKDAEKVCSRVWTVHSFFASQSLHNKKKFKKKSGDVNYEAKFPPFFLLHK